ncbi:MAG: glycoside hydrolase family 2 TIM barrel-domain containing protein, partial [Candidatus Dormibacteraceae bacterium]
RPASGVSLEIQVLPAQVTSANLLDPNALSLVPSGATPIGSETIDGLSLGKGEVLVRRATFDFAQADLWSPTAPALYVLKVTASSAGQVLDTYADSFGLRRIQVDPKAPRLLLNGVPVAFNGVALHDEQVWPSRDGQPHGGPAPSPADELRVIRQAQSVYANLLRTGHTPANPTLLMLADRLGMAVWEEIPLTHSTPETISLAMERGIPQQMLTELDLRDMNHPSVLFHGYANESTGTTERLQAMQTLQELDHEVDGTRLSGQAMYGSDPTDATSQPLDVAGYTFYYGVFYGDSQVQQATAQALATAHRIYPHKPIMILEFGRWADNAAQEQQQLNIFNQTYPALAGRFDTLSGGYVGSAVWWSLEDYWTNRPGISVEHFGLFRADGSRRPVAAAAAAAFAPSSSYNLAQEVRSSGRAVAVRPPSPVRLLGFIGFALGLPTLLLVLLVVGLGLGRRRREWRA